MPPEDQIETPKYLTADEVGQIVNAALTNRLPKMLTPALEAAFKPFSDKLAALQNPAPPSDEGEADGKKKKPATPEVLAMAKQIEDMQKALKEKDDRAAAAEKKNREQKAYADLRSSLEGKVRPELLDLVANNLFHVERRVETDESGNTLFRSTRPTYAGGDPEDIQLPIKSGVEDFLKSEGAKAYLPAPSTGAGSQPLPKLGYRPNSGGPDFTKPAVNDVDKVRRAAERERLATERLKNQ